MNEVFRQHVERLHAKFEELLSMEPASLAALPKEIPKSGIYLFSEGSNHLYIGRSKRLRQRLQYHCGTATDAPFAFKLAREATGFKTTYSKAGSRKELLTNPQFFSAFQSAKERIRRMDIRFVHEPDSNRQALLEIYATICVEAPYNDFDTH